MPRTRRCREPGCHNLCVHPMHYCEQHKDKEQQYLRSRMKWSHAHDNKHKQHVYNTVTRNRDDVKTSQYDFYRSKHWHDLRKVVLEHDNYLCQYCRAIGIVTPAKTVDHIVPIEWQHFYRSKHWHDLRKVVLEHDNYLCQYCRAIGIVTPAKTVDHIVPIEWQPSKMADITNLTSTCSRCHHLKTDWEHGYYGTGNGNFLKRVKAITDIQEIAWQMRKEC